MLCFNIIYRQYYTLFIFIKLTKKDVLFDLILAYNACAHNQI